MSIYRSGRIPAGVEVRRPSWPSFDTAAWAPPVMDQVAAAQAPGASVQVPMIDQDLLDTARMQAAQILQEAAGEAEAAQAAARKDGFEAGRREGLAAAQAELEALRQQVRTEAAKAQADAELIRGTAEADGRARRAEAEAQVQALLAQARDEANAILAEARQERTHRLDEAQESLVDLAVAAAVRLVQGHLALQPQSVVNMVAAGLRRLKDTECVVRTSPADLPLLEAQRSTLERELGAGLLRVQADPGLTQGSYMISSPQGQVDARLEQQGQQLRTALSAALGGSLS